MNTGYPSNRGEDDTLSDSRPNYGNYGQPGSRGYPQYGGANYYNNNNAHQQPGTPPMYPPGQPQQQQQQPSMYGDVPEYNVPQSRARTFVLPPQPPVDSSLSMASVPPMTAEDQFIVATAKREMIFRSTMPIMGGTWIGIYLANHMVLPRYGNYRITRGPALGLSLFAYLASIVPAGAHVAHEIARKSSSAYGDYVREALKKFQPGLKVPSGPSTPSGFSSEPVVESTDAYGADYFKPVYSEESPRQSQDPFNKPMSKRLRVRDNFGSEFSPETQSALPPSEFAPDETSIKNLGGSQTNVDQPPKKYITYEELRRKQDSEGFKF
ncbi:uncharacterized protein LOC141854032 [Brevipalpus obovatus]|uniref:uncharacterized protein LOC141854032 n=1 Tax=Brevipalpus obovatus TaxID=246614 RepID=UPI003D9E77D9